jgi:hypothetical protein
MANKKPLVLSSGQLEELKSGDALAASDIAFDNSGTQITASTVQTALSELDSDLLTFALALS